MKTIRRRATPVAAFCLAALLAACGGTIDDDNGTPAITPTVSISTGVLGTASGPVTVFLRFSTDVGTSFTQSDLTIAGGAVRGTSFTKLSNTDYRIVVDPTGGTSGTLDISLPANTVTAVDGGRSNNQAARFTLPFDMSGPASVPDVHVTDSTNGSATRSQTISFTFAFDVDVGDSFVDADIGLSGGTKSTFTKVSATVYTLLVNVPAATRGAVVLTLPAASFVNAGTGEANLREVQYTAAYDTP